MAATVAHDVRWLVEFPGYVPPPDSASAPIRFWDGEGDLDFDAGSGTQTWTGTRFGAIAAVKAGPIQNVREGAPSRTKVQVLVGDDADTLRHLILRGDPGPLPVRIHFIHRTPGAAAWTRLGRSRLGRLSGGNYVEGAYRYELETYAGDVDRQTPKRWSAEQQQALHPGDRFFEFTADLAQGREMRWPQSA